MPFIFRCLFLLSGCLVLCAAPLFAQEIVFDSLPDCQFDEALRQNNLQIGAVIFNFETGAGCVENLDTSFPVASVGKLFAAAAYLEAVSRGFMNFSDTVVFDSGHNLGDRDGCLSDGNIGQTVTLGYLSEIMIWCSDNAATWLLIEALGADRVQDYITRLNIDGIGPIISYNEVDRLKLGFLDERWSQVPYALASQYYRRGRTNGLVPDYFSALSRLTRSDFRRVNASYLEKYDFNTLTPRAMALFLQKLRADVIRNNDQDSQVAWWLFNTMMLTPRLYSAQSLPGNVYTGGKDGRDTGLTAEVSLSFADLDSRIPQSMAIVFSRNIDLTTNPVQSPLQRPGPLDRALRAVSPLIRDALAPEALLPALFPDSRLKSVTLGTEPDLLPCWAPYRDSNFAQNQVSSLENCWNQIAPRNNFPAGQRMVMGLVLDDLAQSDVRLTFVFTAPEGESYSYQEEVFFQESSGIYWYHTPDQAGTWQIDVYLNLARVYSTFVQVR